MKNHFSALARASLLAASFAALAGSGCERMRADRAEADAPDVPGSPAAATNLEPTVEQVKDTPSAFYGRDVRVTGEVDEIYGDRAFELEGTGWAFDDNIVVLTKTPVLRAGGPLVSDDELIVTGTVRRFTVAEVERELGWDLAPEIEVTLRDRPVLLADSVYNIETRERWTDEGVAAEPVTTIVSVVTMVDSKALAGQQIDLERERVQSVMGKGLWIGPSHMAQVFVLPESMPEDVQPGDMVKVSGTLREVPRDAVKQWELPRDLKGVVRDETLFIDAANVQKQPTPPDDT